MVTKIEKHIDYKDNLALVNQIREIILPSYKNAGSHVSKDIDLCNELYCIQEEGRMLAFFMVGYHEIVGIASCYLGLSACRQEYKSQGLVKSLYLEFARDCRLKEHSIGNRILCYWTTATPIVYYWFCKHFSEVYPNLKGECTDESKLLINLIAKSKYPKANRDPINPFVLRHAAHEINYSDDEVNRVKKATQDLGLFVFDKFALDETKGDRFLMVGYCPDI